MLNRQFLTQSSLGLSFVLALISPSLAQITPNGAGTVVNPQGNQINIAGGTQAGANLFHSFGDFNVNSAQVANFLSNPQTQNILGRINGGNPSFINGLLQVTGGNSNLFLMNPAGIVFGQGASLNVPASFTATTANQIGFGNNVFNAFGDNNFSALTGNPDSFLFTSSQSGSIVNAGDLAVGSGQNLSLIAGNTLNAGRLSAPGGEIQVLAVPGTNRVRLSQSGQVLSLEIVLPNSNELKAVDLPTLLTGSDLPGIVVNPSGQVEVAGTSLPSQQGIAVASGRIDVSSATGNGGTVQIMGDRVAALNSRINANGATGGGTVRLGGEYLGGRDTGIAPALRFNSQRTVVDRDSLIRANATVTGEGGRVIVWADQNTGYFGRITGRGATGRGGFVEVSGKENLAFDGQVELRGFNGLDGSLLLDPANIVISGVGTDDAQIADGIIGAGEAPGATWFISAAALNAIAAGTAIDIAASGNIDFQSNVTFTGGVGAAPVTFTAATINSPAAVILRRRSINIVADSINAPNLGISTNEVGVVSGNIQITANNGNINLGQLQTENTTVNGGSVTLNAPLGTITLNGAILTRSDSGNAGAVSLTSQGNITTSDITSNSFSGNGGAIIMNALNGSITATFLDTRGVGVGNFGGAIDINAGTLFRLTGFCFPGVSICSNGNTGATNLATIIRHGGSITTLFEVGNAAATNGTAGDIDSGTPGITAQTIPVPPAIFTRNNVQIITTLPPAASPTISPELFTLLRNPAPPATPAPVVVGTPPEPTPVVESPTPLPIPTTPVVIPTPIPSPIVVTTPIPTPNPSPVVVITPIPTPNPSPVVVTTPIPISTPISTPSTSPTLTPPLRAVLANVDPQDTRQEPEPPSGTLAFITSPSDDAVSSILSDVLPFSSVSENRNNLNQNAQATGLKSALIYIFFTPQNLASRNEDTLGIILITGRGEPRRVQLSGITRSQVLGVVDNLRSGNESVNLNGANQLYEWFLAPLESELQQQEIDSLIFVLDPELRSLPLESLYDGQQFIRERYTISRP